MTNLQPEPSALANLDCEQDVAGPSGLHAPKREREEEEENWDFSDEEAVPQPPGKRQKQGTSEPMINAVKDQDVAQLLEMGFTPEQAVKVRPSLACCLQFLHLLAKPIQCPTLGSVADISTVSSLYNCSLLICLES